MQVKRPQTIHRCILQNQRSSTETPINITCHVCGGDYETYQIYLQHLFDGTSCGQKKKSTPSKLSPPLVTMTTTSNPLPSTSALKNRELSMNHLYSWTNLCPHFAAATQTRPIPLDDFLYDQATLATLKIELASLIAGIIGEDKLTSLGYPDTDILSIAQTLLQMTQGSCRRVEEGCSGACVRLESVLNTTQLKYQKLKTQLAVGRLNTMRLLEICLPNQRIWSEKKWLEKPMEVILGEIIHEAAHGNVNNLNPSSSVIILD